MSVIDYISQNYVLLIELIGLWILLRVSVHVPKGTIVLTRVALLLLLLVSVLFNLELWTQSFERLSIWRPILTAAIYSLQPIIMLVIIQITAPMAKRQLWILIPELINIPLCFSSQWTRLVCWFSEDNHFQGGALSRLPYIVFAFYAFVFLLQCVVYAKNFTLRDKLCVLYIMLSALGGVLLYLITQYSSDYSAIFASAILLYYLFIYIHMARTDHLTGLMNRQCFYRDANEKQNQISGVVSADMNELKWLNDTKGHDAGDEALKTVAKCLAGKAVTQKYVYRIGGDEFVILYFGKSEAEIKEDVANMRAQLAQTPYVCAFGLAIPRSGENMDQTLLAADKAMYADKAALKRAVLEQGGEVHRRYDD